MKTASLAAAFMCLVIPTFTGITVAQTAPASVSAANSSDTTVNAMTACHLRLSGKYRVRLQLNVDNLLDDDKLQAIDADQVRAYRYVFPTPRRWSITSTLTF